MGAELATEVRLVVVAVLQRESRPLDSRDSVDICHIRKCRPKALKALVSLGRQPDIGAEHLLHAAYGPPQALTELFYAVTLRDVVEARSRDAS